MVESRSEGRMKRICLQTEFMQMLVTRIKSINGHDRRRAFRFITLLVGLTASLVTFSNSQNDSTSGCGHSTVADAWGPEFASQSETFLEELQLIVRRDDKEKFAHLVDYPIQVTFGTKNREVSNASDFIRRYKQIVTPALKQTILTQDPKCLFANGQGVMRFRMMEAMQSW